MSELARLGVLVRQLQGLLVDALEGRKVRLGTDSMVFAGTQTQSKTVAHGLGGTPANVQVQVVSAGGVFYAGVSSIDASNFSVTIRRDDAAHTGTVFFYWRVEG